jgi:putrescine transport system substrate-binding protein
MKKTLIALLALSTLSACQPDAKPIDKPAAEKEKIVNIYNWLDYIGETTLADFTNKTGIKTHYDIYDSNEILSSKILSGASNYDVIYPSSDVAANFIKSKALLPLDPKLLNNTSHLNKNLLAKLAAIDPNNQFLFPYMMGTVALGINKDKVMTALGNLPFPEDEWALVFDPKYTEKIKTCGLAFADTGYNLYLSYNIYKGNAVADFSAETLKAANVALAQIRPHIKLFSEHPTDAFAAGDICVGIAPSGSLYNALDRANAAGKPQNLVYFIPKKGAQIWIDVMAIPASAPHPEAAHAWIDFLGQPEVIAPISDKVNYANANDGATPLVKASLKNNPLIYFDEATFNRLVLRPVVSIEEQQRITSAFNQFKANKIN